MQILSSKLSYSVGFSWFIIYSGYAYTFGFNVFYFSLSFIFSYLLFAFLVVPRIYENSQEKKFYTQGDFVFDKTKNIKDKITINIFSTFLIFFWVVVSIIGGAKLLDFLNILSYESALFLTSFVFLAYILISGFKAVVLTDAISILNSCYSSFIFNIFYKSKR